MVMLIAKNYAYSALTLTLSLEGRGEKRKELLAIDITGEKRQHPWGAARIAAG